MGRRKIIDDVFANITNDIEKIQTKPNMYISYVGSRAFLHLIREVVNNVFDEYKNENNISDFEFSITYNKPENMVYVEDHGRGIPFDELENACTILHSGSKMRRAHGTTAGENGVGITATNALSEVFELTSYRDGHMRSLQFKEGKKTSDVTMKIKSKDKHGLLVGFRPSTLFLGNCTLEIDELDTWLRKEIMLQKNNELKVKFTAITNNKEVGDTKMYQNIKGLGGFLQEFEPESNLLKTPIVLTGKSSIMEKDIPIRSEDGSINLIDMERIIDLDVVINFKPDCQETIRHSFCNDIENIEHGEHSNGVVNGIVTFLKKKTREEVKVKKEEDDVTNNDILYGLTVLVNLNTDFSTGMFTGQTKHKMDNRIFYEPIRKLTIELLEKHFALPENKRVLLDVIKFIKTNIQIRKAMTKVRKTIKKQKSFLESSIIAGYYPPNLIDVPKVENPFGLEVYFVEGDSAGANARIGRYDPDIQGVVGLGGKMSNGYKLADDVDVSKKAPDIAMLFDDILGCGMGKNFSMENCRYDRIIIGSDSDVDGGHIFGGVVANIYKYAKPLIENGMVYRVITPLYALVGGLTNNGKTVNPEYFLYNKEQFFAAYEKKASSVYRIKIDLNDKDYVSGTAMMRFLQTNRDYYRMTDILAKKNMTHPDIIEYMANHVNEYKTTISEEFPEIEYNKKTKFISGSYDGNYHSFYIDEEITNELRKLHEIIAIGNEGHLKYHLYKISGKDDTYLGYQTIYNIMAYCQAQEPDIESRFKGQGELSPLEFKMLAMNPHNRSLLRVGILDAEKAAETMTNLFDKTKASVRKQMIEDADISVEDIDN